MSVTSTHIGRVARPTRKLEKLRPLKSNSQLRHSTFDSRLGTVEEIMNLADSVASHLVNGNFDQNLSASIKSLNSVLKAYGSKLEAIYKDQLDRAFVSFRNGCRDEALDWVSRLCLLELIELRAMQWVSSDYNSYYKQKLNIELDVPITPSAETFVQPFVIPVSPMAAAPAPLLLGPGELLKSSGKYAAPTKVLGKNYCKDEVVIRNSDSGKVNPGAKERLVQITGPTEDKIIYAKQLMEDTIRRNASPVRADGDGDRLGSSSSLNSSTSDDSLLPLSSAGRRTTLLHSYSTNDATLGEYKYTVTVGNDSLKVTGSNLELVRIAKLVLDEYFSPDAAEDAQDEDEMPDVFDSVEPLMDLPTQPLPPEVAKPAPTKTDEAPKTTSIEKYAGPYSWQLMVQLLDSPLSVVLPDCWPRVAREFPTILRKTPIERLTAADVSAGRLRKASTPPPDASAST